MCPISNLITEQNKQNQQLSMLTGYQQVTKLPTSTPLQIHTSGTFKFKFLWYNRSKHQQSAKLLLNPISRPNFFQPNQPYLHPIIWWKWERFTQAVPSNFIFHKRYGQFQDTTKIKIRNHPHAFKPWLISHLNLFKPSQKYRNIFLWKKGASSYKWHKLTQICSNNMANLIMQQK